VIQPVPFVTIAIVPPRSGCPDQVEMFALDRDGQLWHRLSRPGGGWGDWEMDQWP
jgi:hypothetical protein